jgi:hypothetical protein
MVANGIGGDVDLALVEEGQRWVWVAGVLALAAQSPIRGHLLNKAAEPITSLDIQKAANSKRAVTLKALDHFRTRALIVRDDELDCEWVPNFKLYNPDPKASSTEGERLRKRELRARQQIRARLEERVAA